MLTDDEAAPLMHSINSKKLADEAVSPLLGAKKEKSTKYQELEILLLMLAVIALGGMNRVASKIMAEPMNNYAFFLSMFNGPAYVIFYGAILFGRYKLGKVPKSDLLFPFRVPPPSASSPWWCKGSLFNFWDKLWVLKYFIVIGFLEGLGNILSTVANPYVSGIMGSLASQTLILFAIPTAMIMLGTRYTIWQLLGSTVVLIGAVIAFLPNLISQGNTSNGPIGYILLMALSNIPGVISFTTKELIFAKKKNLEIFVVNTTGSFFQLLWWPAMLPISVLLNQTQGLALSTYIKYGFMCFSGTTPHASHADCSPMPTPYLIYIGINIVFNIGIILLLKRASALQGFMAVTAILPISILLFLIHWPLLGASTITLEDGISLLVILVGLVLYRWATFEKEKAKKLEMLSMESP